MGFRTLRRPVVHGSFNRCNDVAHSHGHVSFGAILAIRAFTKNPHLDGIETGVAISLLENQSYKPIRAAMRGP